MLFLTRKFSISESGLLSGFTDWHSHILPAVDDGVKTTDESLHILNLLEKENLLQVCLTPHIMEDVPNQTDYLKDCFEQLQAAYQGNVKLVLASENMLDNLFEKRLTQNDLLPMGEQGIRLLVETSYFNPPIGLNNILLRIKTKGYTPVLAHPERYLYMDEEYYYNLKNLGIQFQLNLPSLTGAYGRSVQKKARMLLEKGWYDLSGMDIHSAVFLETFLQSKLTHKEISKIENILN